MSIFNFFKKKGEALSEELIAPLVKNEIVMTVDESVDEVPVHTSKIGGRPFLSRDFVWPVFTSKDDGVTRPLSFLCQINLADVKQYDKDGLLPDKGMLYFFYECEAFRWGFDPDDKGSARIFYFEDTNGFVPIEWPKDVAEEYIIPEMTVRFMAQTSYPKFEELECHSQVNCDWEDYEALFEKMGVDTYAENHKLLGYADIIQGEMLSECERVSRGLYCGDAESYSKIAKDVKEDIEECAKDWTLLLQLSTLEKDDWELMWGDCGMLYFYIRKQDLFAKRFENAWFSLQCG